MRMSRTSELFRQLTELTPVLTPETDLAPLKGTAAFSRMVALRGKLLLRPHVRPLLGGTVQLLRGWRTEKADARRCPALRRGNSGHPGMLCADQLLSFREVYRGDPVPTLRFLGHAMVETFVSAFRLARMQPELLQASAALQDQLLCGALPGMPSPESYIENELNPGIFVLAGLASAAIKLQPQPCLNRTARILLNSGPLVVDWSGMSEEAFAVADEVASCCSPSRFGVRNGEWLGYDRDKFELTLSGSHDERLEFTEPACQAIAELARTRVPSQTPYRIGCGGRRVPVGTGSAVDDSVLWLTEVLAWAWPMLVA